MKDFYETIQGYLSIDAHITKQEGPTITNGEPFVVRFDVKNIAPQPARAAGVPMIAFTNIRIRVLSTLFADVTTTDPDYSDYQLVDPSNIADLKPGETPRSTEVGFVAKADLNGSEAFAQVDARAFVDLDQFFQFRIQQEFSELKD